MTNRVTLVCGLSEVVTCSWLFRQAGGPDPTHDHLIVYGRNVSMPRQHKVSTLSSVQAFWNWSGIADLTDWSEQASSDLAAGVPPVLPEQVATQLSQADEVYLHTIWRPIEKFILQCAPQARLVLFDNGLDSHLERQVSAGDNQLAQGCIRQSDLQRVDRFMYTLGDLIPLPSFAPGSLVLVPGADDLLEHYRFMARRAGVLSLTGAEGAPSALSLGTSFYRLGKFGPEDEARVYSQFHKDARRLDYDIIWKSHPRAGRALIEEPGGSVTEPFDQSLPIEFLPLVRNIALCGSMSSTALLTLKKVYGIPYVILGRALAERLTLPWLSSLHQYANEKIPARLEMDR